MKILQWGECNLVLFNSSKTQNIVFSNKRSIFPNFTDFGDDIIDPSESLGILGINLDNSLIWHNHTVNVAKNAIKRLRFLRRCKKYLSPSNLLLIYKTYIRPLMEYNCHLWAGAPPSSRLKIVQFV